MAAYYDRERKTWYVKFRYTDWQGNSKSTSKRGFKTKKEALAYENEQKQTLKEKPSISIQKLAEEFLSDYRAHHRVNSYKVAEKNYRMYIKPYLDSILLSDITPLVIRKWQSELLQFKLSESSLCAINTTLNTMLNHAVKYYGLASNPMKIVGKQGKFEKRLEFLELDEWEKLDSCIDDLYMKTVLNIMFWSGIRLGELRGLTREDIDLEHNTININKQIAGNDKLGPTKTKYSDRVISIPSVVTELIQKYLETDYDNRKYIFDYSTFKVVYGIKKYCKIAGMKPFSPHALRHSHASFLINQGVPINSISKRLGHSSPTITLNIYSHCYKEQDNNIANMINTLLESS